MKKAYTLILLVCFASLLVAQNTARAQFDTIEKCMKTGDATALSEHFSEAIECDLLGEEGIYSKAQATMVTKRFFEKYLPKSFAFKHSSDKQTIKYAIGTLHTLSGEKMRVTIFIKEEDAALKIQQLRIERE
jgi:hypothetical protein